MMKKSINRIQKLKN